MAAPNGGIGFRLSKNSDLRGGDLGTDSKEHNTTATQSPKNPEELWRIRKGTGKSQVDKISLRSIL